MASRYRSFLKICERWPLDPSKGEKRDLGVLLRKRISESFRQGESTNIEDTVTCDKMLSSLENICSDKYKKQYPRNYTNAGALGLELDTLKASISEEAVEEFKKQDRTLTDKWRKMKNS